MTVGKPVVYVVDDEKETRQSLTTLIRFHDFNVEAYASAESFLDEFDSSLSGCIVTDLRMPGMSGAELQQRLLAEAIHTPIIFLTGFADVPTTVLIMQHGAATLLEKPYREDELITAVRKAIRRDEEILRQTAWRRDIAARLRTLSEGEIQVMNFVVEGKPNKMIAMTLDVSMRTVDRRRRNVLDKMKIDSVPELARSIAAYRQHDNNTNGDLEG